jgi:hypothetical protein
MRLKTTYRVEQPDLESARTIAGNAFVGSFQETEDSYETRLRTLAGDLLRVLGHPETVEHVLPAKRSVPDDHAATGNGQPTGP